jgi:arabinofuranan 3-O-arabinosyltransferase
VRRRWSTQTKTRAELALLATVAYVPILLSSPGRVSADSKQALLVDPGGFLAGAGSLWDPGTGAGTVPHQHLGYLWPMGPWFWLFDVVGVPTWIAQRLWLGTLVLVAALGARWFLRSIGVGAAPALVGALVYALTPYPLAFTARMSVILLPWVGLPWLVELARRSVRCGGWRHPALFALVVFTAAGVNATSLVLVAIGPALLLVWMAATGHLRATVGATARVALLSVGASAWWLAGLRVQGAYGMPVLQLTENLSDIARWSSPGEVLRGMGNWFFAGRDRLGYSVDQAATYLDSLRAVALTAVVPALALAALVLLRGRLRLIAAAWVVVGAVVSVGAWPIEAPSAYGRAFRWLAEETSVGLALRNSHRAVPVLVLGMALALALALDRLPRARWQTGACWVAGTAAVGMAVPALPTGLLSDHVDRPQAIPAHWVEVAELLDARGVDTTGNPRRVLEIPGSPFAAYRWGNTVEPVLPALMDRPQLAREVLPYGSPATANLLDALDRRMQEGVLETRALAPIARLFAAADVVVRNDLQWERFRAPEPHGLWSVLADPLPPGVVGVDRIGGPVTGEPDPVLGPVDERWLARQTEGADELPSIGVLQVDGASPILRVVPDAAPVVVAGDGEGLVDLAAAGLLDGTGLVHYADALDSDALAHALDRDAWLVVTDTNRRRIQTWFYAIRDVRGPTERAGETLVEPSGYDQRLEIFPGSTDRSRTVAEHLGGQVTATSTGGAARPEDRAMAAFDGDPGTAWRVGGADPVGHRLVVELDEPVHLSELVVVQPQDGPRDRQIEAIRVHLDGEVPARVSLGPTSLDPQGQIIDIPPRRVQRIALEIAEVSRPPFDPALANAVGFAEVRIDGVRLAETIVLPSSLLERVGHRSVDHGLDLVLSRLRYDPYDRGRTDTERHLDRTVHLTSDRSFGLTGTARLSPDAPDAVLDDLLGTGRTDGAALTATASSRLAGDLASRAWSALDGDPASVWRSAFGPQEGQWFQVDLAEPVDLDTVIASWIDDGSHSSPRRLLVEVDGELIAELELTADGAEAGVRQVEVPVNRSRVSRLRLVVDEIERRAAPPGDPAPFATLPVGLRSLDLGTTSPVRGTERIDTGCRDDLVSIDGAPLAVRISGPVSDLRTGLSVEACHAVELAVGRHRLVSEPGWRTGIDVDRLVLSSAPGGGPAPPDLRDVIGDARADLVEVAADRTSWRARLDTDGSPVWLVMAQSHNRGWVATTDGRDLGAPQLVGGFANGWLIEPGEPGSVEIHLAWTPQRSVWWGIALSALVVGVCLGLALGTATRAVPIELGSTDRLPVTPLRLAIGPVPLPRLVVGVGSVLLVVLVVSRPWIAVIAGAVTLTVALVPASTWVLALAGPATLGGALLLDRPVLGWVAVALVLATVVGHELAGDAGTLTGRRGDGPPPATPTSPAPRPTGRESGRRGHDHGS